MVRYLRQAPAMWTSEINNAVVGLADPTPGERALDIGAGMGPGAVLAASRGARVMAVEPTPFMRRVLAGRRRISRHGSRIEVSDGSAERLPIGDDSVDVVWAVNSMHHWVDPEVATDEIVRVLKSGGRLVLVDEDFASPDHPDHESFGEHHGPEHHGFTMVDVEKLGERLADQGLVDVVAGERLLGTRPVFAVTAAAP
ncbi:MAG: methyltransferase domain-containing protein [Actinomycetota bacterium]